MSVVVVCPPLVASFADAPDSALATESGPSSLPDSRLIRICLAAQTCATNSVPNKTSAKPVLAPVAEDTTFGRIFGDFVTQPIAAPTISWVYHSTARPLFTRTLCARRLHRCVQVRLKLVAALVAAAAQVQLSSADCATIEAHASLLLGCCSAVCRPTDAVI